MVVIIADEGNNDAGAQLHRLLLSSGVQAEYIPLENVQVQPCVSCGHCTKKSLGHCITRDDGEWIYPKVASADAVVLVTPVVFGCYSFKTKRVLDKFGLFMDGHYFVRNGEMVKGGLPGKQFTLFAVGTGELMDGEAEVFEKLIHETILITRGKGGAFFTGPSVDPVTLNKIAAEVKSA
jgi:multimeric flavodoxin WrbA